MKYKFKKKNKKKRVRKFFLGGLMKKAKKGIKGAAKIGLFGGVGLAASHLFGKKNKGGGEAAEAEAAKAADTGAEGGIGEEGMEMMGHGGGAVQGGMGGLFGAVYGKMSKDKQARINKILAEK